MAVQGGDFNAVTPQRLQHRVDLLAQQHEIAGDGGLAAAGRLRAIGFDFDTAPFTHVDSKVTFEVLLASFGLDADPALTRLGSLVHYLDVGGIPIPEAAGFAAIVSGSRTLEPDDDALLGHLSPVLDSLYRSYLNSERDGSAK